MKDVVDAAVRAFVDLECAGIVVCENELEQPSCVHLPHVDEDGGGVGETVADGHTTIYVWRPALAGAPVVYVCSCMESESKLLRGMDVRRETAESIARAVTPCVHARVCSELVRTGRIALDVANVPSSTHVDDASFADASVPISILHLDPDSQRACVLHVTGPKLGDLRSFTTTKNREFWCRRCCRTDCSHLRTFAGVLDATPVDDLAHFSFAWINESERAGVDDAQTTRAISSAVSKRPRKLTELTPGHRRRVLREGPGFLDACEECEETPRETPCTHCVPRRPAICPRCSSASAWTRALVEDNAKLVCLETGTRVRVYELVCGSCQHRIAYDGAEDGIYNFSNKTLLTHEVVYDWLARLTYQRSATTHSLFKQMVHAHARTAAATTGIATMVSRSSLTSALQHCLPLVDFDNSAAFCCPWCRYLNPSELCVIMDGKTCGLLKRMRRPRPSLETEAPREHERRLSDYVVLGNATLRKLVRAYAREAGVSREDYAAMRSLALQHCPSFVAVLDGVSSGSWTFASPSPRRVRRRRDVPTPPDEPPAAETCPVPFRRFLSAICTPYPTSAIVDASLTDQTATRPAVLVCLCEEAMSLDVKARVMTGCPWLADMMTELDWHMLPSEFEGLMKHVCARRSAVVSDPHMATMARYEAGAACGDGEFVFGPMFDRGSRRLAASYAADAKQPRRMDEDCVKLKRTHAALSEGIFAMFCPHGLCILFEILSSHEGPSTAFKLIMSRFERAPAWIVYDNACTLHRYCLNREPVFFRDTRFKVDRMHMRGHTGCPEGYDLDKTPPEMLVVDPELVRRRAAERGVELTDADLRGCSVTVGDLNSQSAEQANSRLNFVATTIMYMRQSNFMATLRYFFFRYNAQTIARVSGKSEFEVLRTTCKA